MKSRVPDRSDRRCKIPAGETRARPVCRMRLTGRGIAIKRRTLANEGSSVSPKNSVRELEGPKQRKALLPAVITQATRGCRCDDGDQTFVLANLAQSG